MIAVVQAYDMQQAQCATRGTPPRYQMLGGKKHIYAASFCLL